MYTNKTRDGWTPDTPSRYGKRGTIREGIKNYFSTFGGTRYDYNRQDAKWKRRNVKIYPLAGWAYALGGFNRERFFWADEDKPMERWNVPAIDTPKSLKNAHWGRPDELQGMIECPSPLPETVAAPVQTAPESPVDLNRPEPENDVIIDFTPEPEDEQTLEPPAQPSDASHYVDLDKGIISGKYRERMFEFIFEFTADGFLTIITDEGEIFSCTYLISYEAVPGHTRTHLNDEHYFLSIILEDSRLEWMNFGGVRSEVENGVIVTTVRHADYGSGLSTGIGFWDAID
jgi:hypothetical protein